jgi:hypothetical protein
MLHLFVYFSAGSMSVPRLLLFELVLDHWECWRLWVIVCMMLKGGGHTTNTWLEGRCMYMFSSLGPHQVVVKQPRILCLNKSNSSAMED